MTHSLKRVALVTALGVLALTVGCANKDRIMATAAMNRGVEQAGSGNFSRAMSYLEEATELDPTYGEPYLYLGMIRLMQYHAPDTAVIDLQRATELLPDNHEAHYYLAIASNDLGRVQEAAASFERAVELNPNYTEAHYRFGELLRGRGEMTAAIDAYTRAIQANPRFPDSFVRLGSIYMTYEAFDAAAQVFSEGARVCEMPARDIEDRTTRCSTVNNLLGSAYLRSGQIEAAIAAFQVSINLEPGAINNYHLGLAYNASFEVSEDQQDRAQAIEYLEFAQRRCGQLGSQARCNQITRSLDRLQNPEGDDEERP